MSSLRKLRRAKNTKEFGISGKLYHQMPRDHVDVLQNIEFALVSAWRDNEMIDDSVIASALKISIAGGKPADERTAGVVQRLSAIREVRPDISDELWNNGLKVVLESVHTHSTLARGDTGYLDFISRFL